MSEFNDATGDRRDRVPGEPGPARARSSGVGGYLLGLALAGALSIASFAVVGTQAIWAPGIPIALIVLAVAQMGVHLVFFLHITTGPDNTNNVLALCFGLFIVGLLLIGSLYIMDHLNAAMMPMTEKMGGAF